MTRSREASIGGLIRPNDFVVDLAAVAHNAQELRRLVGSTFIYGAVKADAYGYGIGPVADTLTSCGVDGLSMVSIADAVLLRRGGIDNPILLYPGVPFTSAAVAAIEEYELTPTIVDESSAKLLSSAASRCLAVYVKVDVGLERLGAIPEVLSSLLGRLREVRRIRVAGLYAHMHVSASGWADGYLEWQYERFLNAIGEAKRAGLFDGRAMVASTGVLTEGATMLLDAVDPGRWFFGLVGGALHGLDLRPAFHSLETRLIQVKDLPRRTEFQAESLLSERGVRRVGILPVGRIDGIAGVTSGQVLVRGRRVELVGSPSIEHTRVDLTPVGDAQVGDSVVIIGKQGEECISPEDVAQFHGITSPCLLALGVGPGFRRTYLPRTEKGC